MMRSHSRAMARGGPSMTWKKNGALWARARQTGGPGGGWWDQLHTYCPASCCLAISRRISMRSTSPLAAPSHAHNLQARDMRTAPQRDLQLVRPTAIGLLATHRSVRPPRLCPVPLNHSCMRAPVVEGCVVGKPDGGKTLSQLSELAEQAQKSGDPRPFGPESH